MSLDVVDPASVQDPEPRAYDFGIIPVPKRLHYDPSCPPKFGLFLNIMFGVVSAVGEDTFMPVLLLLLTTAATANLYYNQPLLSEST